MSDNRGLPSPEARDVIRQGAELVLNPHAEWLAELHNTVLDLETTRDVLADPVLAEGVRRANLSNLLRWAESNVRNPGARVEPNLSRELIESSREFVRHGLDDAALETWRLGQNVAWRRWMEICFELTSDAAVLHEVLAATSTSIYQFTDETIAAVTDLMRRERAELTQGTHAERLATVSLLLEGAPVSRNAAETRLGHSLTGPHTAAIIWGNAEATGEELERAAELVVRLSGATRRLTVLATSRSLWLWLPTTTVPAEAQLESDLAAIGNVRVALGRSRTDVDGFRRSHLDAAGIQRMMARLDTARLAGNYADAQLVALLSHDVTHADEFIADTLGELATADEELIVTLRTYLAEQCNAARVAEILYAHRNTIVRRLARCDELLPRPLAENAVSVGAALELLSWRRNGPADH